MSDSQSIVVSKQTDADVKRVVIVIVKEKDPVVVFDVDALAGMHIHFLLPALFAPFFNQTTTQSDAVFATSCTVLLNEGKSKRLCRLIKIS